MTEVDAFLTNCRLADGRLVDIGIAGGKIAAVGEGAAASSNSAPGFDIAGDLVLPGLVDGHMHLDKTLTGLPWMGHAAGPTRMSRIETDKTILPHLPISTEERAGNLIRECVARHDASAHPCGHRSRKRPGQAGGRACRPRALSRPSHRANRRFPPERCHALPRRSRLARRGGPERRRSGRRHRSAGNRP